MRVNYTYIIMGDSILTHVDILLARWHKTVHTSLKSYKVPAVRHFWCFENTLHEKFMGGSCSSVLGAGLGSLSQAVSQAAKNICTFRGTWD